MGTHGKHEHELKIDSTTDQFILVRDDEGRAMYQVIEEIPQYRNPLGFIQTNWIDGHGQHTRTSPDAYFEGQSIDTTQEGRVFLGPLVIEVQESNDSDLDSAVVKFAWDSTNSKLLCITAGQAYIYGTKWTVASTTVAGGTDLREFGAYMFAARGSSTAYMYSNDGGDNWTTSTLTFKTVEKFLVAHNAAGIAEVLWSFKEPNEVYSNAGTGINGGTEWSSAAYIGDSANNITTLFLSNDNFLVGREDGLFHYDSDGGQHQLRPDLRANRSTDNFKYVTEWQAGIYHSEIDGMGEITAYNAYAPMGPLFDLGDISRRGDVVGLTADKDWIYVAIYDGTNYTIYKGREVRKGGILMWQWCPWVHCGTNAIATMLVVQHSATDRRLWFGYGNSTAYVILSDNPTDDSAARFCASGYMRMSYDYGTDPNWDKLWQSAVIELTGGATGETVQVKYRDDTDTGAGSECVAAYNTNGVVETNLTAALKNKRIQFELHLASNTNTATPEVSYFEAKGVEKPTTVRVHEAYYAIGDKPSDRAKTIRTLLRTARTSTTLIKFADLRYGQTTGGTSSGDYVWCVMEPGFPKEVEIKHEKGRQPELAIQVRLREVSFTIS